VSPARPDASARWALAVAILGSTMAFVDGTVVNVALPVIQRDLKASVTTMQWVVEAYALFLASLVLVGGALGDRLGRRRVFSAGIIIFTIASVATGLAPTPSVLVLARAVQGVGGALLVPGSLAIISAAYDEDSRGAAIGTWSATSAITSAIGPVLGGWLVGHASWRWLFFMNVPIGAVTLLLASVRVKETRDDSAPARMDWPGASLAVLGLGLVVYALLESSSLGLGSPRVVMPLLGGVIVLGVFVAGEAHVQSPMVPLGLFRSRTFAGTNALTLLLYAALGGALFFVPFNLIQVQHYTPAESGAALLPFVLFISTMSRWVGGLVPRYGARLPLVVGPLIASAGFALMAVPGVGGSYWATYFPAIMVMGLGMGITVAPLTTAVMGSVDAHHAGLASGINNAVARTAGLLAVAALGVVLVTRFNGALDDKLAGLGLAPEIARGVDEQRVKLGGADFGFVADPALRGALRTAFDDSFVAGFRALMVVGAGLAALGGMVALLVIEPKHR
jgi:EmrB/QacA subfamily drug resistance transporter